MMQSILLETNFIYQIAIIIKGDSKKTLAKLLKIFSFSLMIGYQKIHQHIFF